ncbi:hypothetical protein ARMGADRAFT_158671 [Armillaria gallica]|uniref:Uncharacterized protein n=1 Tax=Armillaria gallica TaxID=47427 RepID=A0A2H3C882_ARMGA|nr:hypothetical protein ARMGADRAFT_158671 [Armillaria gallica]
MPTHYPLYISCFISGDYTSLLVRKHSLSDVMKEPICLVEPVIDHLVPLKTTVTVGDAGAYTVFTTVTIFTTPPLLRIAGPSRRIRSAPRPRVRQILPDLISHPPLMLDERFLRRSTIIGNGGHGYRGQLFLQVIDSPLRDLCFRTDCQCSFNFSDCYSKVGRSLFFSPSVLVCHTHTFILC